MTEQTEQTSYSLSRYPETLAVVRLAPGAEIPLWAESSSVFSITATASETSLVCAGRSVPKKARHQKPLTAFCVDGELDLRGGMDLLGGSEVQGRWSAWIDEAEQQEPGEFTGNGWTVVTLQAAWSAIHHARDRAPGAEHVAAALTAAVAVGGDTDTVAAVAGGLLGARYGASGLPERWAPRVHGWPGLWSDDLVRLAVLTAHGG